MFFSPPFRACIPNAPIPTPTTALYPYDDLTRPSGLLLAPQVFIAAILDSFHHTDDELPITPEQLETFRESWAVRDPYASKVSAGFRLSEDGWG